MSESPPPTAVDLLQHAGFVRAVARAAVRGDHDVDDVVQETWVSSLGARPDEVRRPRGWLGAVVHRRAADAARSAGRRREREKRAARPEALEPTVDVVARTEISQRLVGAVMALDEPYRTVVLLRYFDDLPPREIAARTGVPVETARTRVKRGLQRLRQTLDEGQGGRSNWVASLAPLVPAGSIPVPEVASGGLAVAKKLLLGAIALLSGPILVFMDTVSAPGSAGWYGLACVLLAVVGLCLMVVDVVRGRGRRAGSAILLAAGIAFAAANIAAFVLTLSADRFAIFERAYILSAAFVGPALMVVLLLVFRAFYKKLGGLGLLGFLLWIGSVAATHFWIIAQASASV